MTSLRVHLESRDSIIVSHFNGTQSEERFLLEVKPDGTHGEMVSLTRQELWSLLGLLNAVSFYAPNADATPEKGATDGQ